MKINILGGGVVGMATAYYLAKEGHEVVVIERHDRPAMESSFGNAGGLCPSFAGPWAAPGMPLKTLKMAFQKDAAIRVSLTPNIDRWKWGLQWLKHCNAEDYRENKLHMQRIAHYSLACLKQIIHKEDIHFDFVAGGVLQLFQTPQEVRNGQLSSQALASLGIRHQLLEPNEINAIEPALQQARPTFCGGLYLPEDASGDSHLFAQALWRLLEKQGVQFYWGTTAEKCIVSDGAVKGVTTQHGEHLADATIVAMGSYAPLFLRQLGIKLPVYPLKGYSITADITDDSCVPNRSIMDEHSKVMISRLGHRIRAAGMAELVGYDMSLPPDRKALLIRTVQQLFPHGVDYENTSFWSGLRPMTPDGPPILGTTGFKGLFLNCGHGSNGWTQACGSSRVVADIVCGKAPQIDMRGLTLARYSQANL